MPLVLVPPPGGKGPRPPKGRRCAASLFLFPDESRALRVVLKSLRTQFGCWQAVSDGMGGIAESTLFSVASGRDPGSGTLVLRAAKLANISVERLLSGKPVAAARCPWCGQEER